MIQVVGGFFYDRYLDMSVFLLTWNPTRFTIPDQLWKEEIEQIAKTGTNSGTWSSGSRKGGVFPGDKFLLVRLAKDRGIVASGVATSGVFQLPHWDEIRNEQGDTANYVSIDWDVQVPVSDRLRTEILLKDFPEVPWDNLMGSGVRVVEEVAEELLSRWYAHVGIEPNIYPDDLPTYIEGPAKMTVVNRYERNYAARAKCIEYHGTACHVCGFDGASAYGKMGANLIHVHHLIEISTIGVQYQVDPIKDLVPVCPNCHAMIHRRRPAYSVAEVQKMIRPKSKPAKSNPK